jgi:hypothetical protein
MPVFTYGPPTPSIPGVFETARQIRELLPGFMTLLLLTACHPLLGTDTEMVTGKRFDTPVLTVRSRGAEGNKYGFEGGRALKVNGTYHLFTSEMVGDPHWVKSGGTCFMLPTRPRPTPHRSGSPTMKAANTTQAAVRTRMRARCQRLPLADSPAAGSSESVALGSSIALLLKTGT